MVSNVSKVVNICFIVQCSYDICNNLTYDIWQNMQRVILIASDADT